MVRSLAPLAAALAALTACSSDGADPVDTAADTTSDVVPDAAGDTAEPDGADAADGSGTVDDGTIRFGELGQLGGDTGRGSFRFGAATAAAQIEDGLTRNDWYFWTLPTPEGGQGRGEFVGDAVRGATFALDDIGLMQELGLDAYRFSIDWSRIEPERDVISEEGIAHYRAFLEGLQAAGIRPMVTLHHFSSPIWVDDFRDGLCRDADTPSDTDLCGWGHPVGGPEVIAEIEEHAALLAREFGDLVDEWCTLNEPVNYLVASYGAGVFPPGGGYLIANFPRFIRVVRDYLAGHVAMYDAIVANDTGDADDDGRNAFIGLSLSVVDWTPARGNVPSANPEDVAAADRVAYVYHHLVPDSLLNGTFDTDVDGTPDEQHPDWAGKLDWLGVQYYFRTGVTGENPVIAAIGGMFCFGEYDFGSCLEPEDPSWWVPDMHYEFYAPGWLRVLRDLHAEHPGLPLVVTEGGIATRVGERRSQNIVRTLEQVGAALDEGIDVRGYYHWSLMDNFEWAEGYGPKFGLFAVDVEGDYARSPTGAVPVYADIIERRALTPEVRERFGGNGPMVPEQ